LPQLLYYLENDTIDFGTVAIYTCSASCGNTSSYLDEYAFVQLIPGDEGELAAIANVMADSAAIAKDKQDAATKAILKPTL
jgi:hypothetical protein